MTRQKKIKKPPVWKRRYLVQKGYQLTYSLLIALIGSVALLIAFYSIKYLESTNIIPDLTAPDIQVFNVATFIFVSWFLLGIIYTHTTAGPVTQLIAQLNKIANFKLDKAKINFRRGDDLQDLPEYFNNMVKVLQFRHNEETTLMKEIETHLAQAVKSELSPEDKKNEIVGALKYCIQRTENLIVKKRRYLRPMEENLKMERQ